MNDSTSTQARILIVDDEPVNVRLLERVLADAGYRDTRSTTDSREVLALYETFKPDVLVLALMMPHCAGVAVRGQCAIPRYGYLPGVVLTADARAEARERALSAGARDFLTKPFDRLEVLLRIKNLLDIRRLYLEFERQNRSLVQMVEERTQKFLQSEKLATMGSLLAGVAHELNNPLAVLIGQAHLLREAVPDEALRQRAEKIGAAAEPCGRLVKKLLPIARPRPPAPGHVFLNQPLHHSRSPLPH